MRYRYRTDEELKDSGVEWIGKIPKDWEVLKLRNIGNISTSSVDKKINEDEKIVNLVNYVDVYNSKTKELFNNNEYMKVSAKEIQISVNNLLKGDVLFTPSSETVHDIGYSAVVMEDLKNTLYSYHLIRLRFNKEMHLNFKKYIFWSNSFLSYLSSRATGTTRKTLSINNFKNNIVTIPSIKEQEKIANFLDKKTSQFDSIISKKEKLIEKLEEAKKSLISEVVTGKVKVVKSDEGYELVKRKSDEMKDSGVEWLGDIPKDWEVKRLRFLGKLQNGISKNSEEFGFGYPFVSYSNVYRNIELPQKIEGLINSTKEERKIYSVREGDVLFTRTSETINEIGLASTCMDTIENSTFAGFLIRFRPSYKRLYKGFSKYYFRCDLNRKYFVKEMNLVTRASLSQNLLNNLAVTLPDYKEQVEIYNALELKIGAINLSIDNLKYQIDKLKEAKQSLISEAVTGKIEILD